MTANWEQPADATASDRGDLEPLRLVVSVLAKSPLHNTAVQGIERFLKERDVAHAKDQAQKTLNDLVAAWANDMKTLDTILESF